jgi:hypothetical protein
VLSPSNSFSERRSREQVAAVVQPAAQLGSAFDKRPPVRCSPLDLDSDRRFAPVAGQSPVGLTVVHLTAW